MGGSIEAAYSTAIASATKQSITSREARFEIVSPYFALPPLGGERVSRVGSFTTDGPRADFPGGLGAIA